MARFRDNCPLDCKVYVGELGNNGTRHELEEAFGYYGPLKNVWVARNPPGFAFVMFEDPRDARDAVRALDGKIICGRRVRVELSTGKSRREGGPGGGGGYGGRGGGRREPPPYERGYGSRRSPPPVSRRGDPYSRPPPPDERDGYGSRSHASRRYRSRSPRSPRAYSRRYSRSRSRSISPSRSPSPRTPPNGAAP